MPSQKLKLPMLSTTSNWMANEFQHQTIKCWWWQNIIKTNLKSQPKHSRKKAGKNRMLLANDETYWQVVVSVVIALALLTFNVAVVKSKE